MRIASRNMIDGFAARMSAPHSFVQLLQTVRILFAVEQRTLLARLPHLGSNGATVVTIVAQPNGNLFVLLARACDQLWTAERGQLGRSDSERIEENKSCSVTISNFKAC